MPLLDISGMPDYRSYQNVQPFTVRDGAAYLDQLEALKRWLRDYVIPTLNTEAGGLATAWETQTRALIEAFEVAVVTLTETVNQAVDGVEELKDASEAAAAASAASAALAEQFASDVVAFQDTAIAGLVGDDDSATREAMNGLFATPASVLAVANNVVALSTEFDQKLAANVTPEMFGAVGDGVADDTVPYQAMWNHLMVNGGHGSSAGTYRIVTSINVLDPEKSASYDGLNSTKILTDFTAEINAFNFRNADKWTIENFVVDSIGVEKTAHGLAMANCRDTIVDNALVYNYALSAGMFYKNASFPGESLRNIIRDSTCDGAGIGRNGFFLESSPGSVIENCHVKNLSNSPGYGLQLKNNSIDCHIIGGSVDGAQVGVAFGYEMADSWANGCTVTGVSVKNCVHAFLGSRMTNCTIDMFADMSGAIPLTAIRLAGNAIKNFVTVTVSSIKTGQTVVYAQDSDNVVDVPLINGFDAATLLELGANAGNNYITYGRIVGVSLVAIPTLPLPALGTNVVVYESETAWTNVPLSNSWVVALGRTLQVKRIGNVVYMRGQVEAGIAGTIGTIPGGFRPATQTIVIPPVLNTASVSITTGGAITITAAGIGGSASLNHSWPIF